MHLFFSLFVVSFFSFQVIIHSQTTLHVPTDYTNIQSALNAADNGDTVLVEPGTYMENLIWPNKNGIKLLSRLGKELTIINGNSLGAVVSILTANIDTSTIIKGLTLTKGGNVSYGGGLCINNASVKLVDLIISYNQSSNSGGAVYLSEGANVVIDSCIIRGNTSSVGGGIYRRGGASTAFMYIKNSFIDSNSAFYGGGIFLDYSYTDIQNTVFRNNISSDRGGAIFTSGGQIYLSNDTYYENKAQYYAAALYSMGTIGKIEYTNIFMNKSPGANLYFENESPFIQHCNIYNNNQAMQNGNNMININAGFNYWGDVDGPYQFSTNNSAQGDTIGLHIIYLPYLSIPDTTAPPLQIEDLSFTNPTYSSIELNWTPSKIADLEGYKVYWDDDSVGNLKNILDVGNISTYKISDLIGGSEYRFSVSCYDKSGNESVLSEEIIAQTMPPVLKLTTNKISFTDTKVNDTTSVPFAIISENDSPLQIISISNTGSSFKIGNLSLNEVPGHDTLITNISFYPNHFGKYEDTLIIATNGGTEKIILYGVSPYPQVSINEKIVEFGSVIRDRLFSKNIYIKNTSINILVIDSIFARTDIFTITPTSGIINKSDSLEITVKCYTNSFGIFNDTLHILSNTADREHRLPLSANTPFQVIFNGATLNYGSVAVGDSISQTLLIGNIFNGSTNIDSIYTNTSAFQVSPSHAFLNSLDTLQLQIKYKPEAFLTSYDTVYIVNNSLNACLWIALTGNSPWPNAILNKTQIIFDTTALNTQNSTTIKLTNTSINDLQISSIYTLADYFIVQGIESNMIRKGDTLEIKIDFTPNKHGTFTDTLFIKNNSKEEIIGIPIIGTSKIITSISDVSNSIPTEFRLFQNYPNPFNPNTMIQYSLPKASHVVLKVYDVLGNEIVSLVNEEKSPGYYSVKLDGTGLASGIYIYTIKAGNYNSSKKLILIK